MILYKVITRLISYDRPMTATRPAATRPAATLTLIAQLSKSAIRKTPETLLGMPLRQYAALAYIAAQEGMAQQTLSEILCMDANNLVLLLNELEDEGLVRRVRDPADRRRHVVQITDDGLARFDRAREARAVVEDEVLGALSAAERDELHRLLAKAAAKH
jgi:DNA-binding MarR family transcriptional regulator